MSDFTLISLFYDLSANLSFNVNNLYVYRCKIINPLGNRQNINLYSLRNLNLHINESDEQIT